MNQKPIKDVEEERKDEGSGMDNFFAAIFLGFIRLLYDTPHDLEQNFGLFVFLEQLTH